MQTPLTTDINRQQQWFDAIKSADLSTVQTLVKEGFNVHTLTPDGYNGFLMSLLQGHAHIAEFLMPLADVHHCTSGGWCSLGLAIRFKLPFKLIETLTEMLGQAAFQNTRLQEKWTPLMHAAYWDNLECVSLLLPRSQPNDINKQGNTALMLATLSGFTAGVELLLPHTDLSIRNDDDMTAFDQAEHTSDEIQRLLEDFQLSQTEKQTLIQTLPVATLPPSFKTRL